MEPAGCSYIGKGNMSIANKRLLKDVDALMTFALPFQYNTTQRCMFYYKYYVFFLAIKSDQFFYFYL
jgi:hypothetical protein